MGWRSGFTAKSEKEEIRRSMKQITINVPNGTQLLHVLAVIDKGREIHYEAKFCDLRDGNTEYSLNSNDEKNIGESKGNV